MSKWFVAPRPRPLARLRLFAVPFAGRGASLFYPWHAALPDWIDLAAVQLPGREGRLAEPALKRLDTIIAQLVAEIRPRLDKPYALFGHSMGALICYELARALREQGAPAPVALVLSGREAPTNPRSPHLMHPLSDAAFVDEMQARFDGIPKVVLEQPELLALLLPTLRGDIEAIETYQYRPGPKLPMPFFLYGGEQDWQSNEERLAGWGTLTEGSAPLRLFPGGHFYIQTDGQAVRAALVQDLSSVA